jgi:hypothetical protein
MAISTLRTSIESDIKQIGEASDLLGSYPVYRALNVRQQRVIKHALDHPGFVYTIESHRKLDNLSYQTARVDLLDMSDKGLLDMSKRGRAFVFGVPKDLESRLAG